jgi:hypothetical protein
MNHEPLTPPSPYDGDTSPRKAWGGSVPLVNRPLVGLSALVGNLVGDLG